MVDTRVATLAASFKKQALEEVTRLTVVNEISNFIRVEE